ncbi:mitochondrial alternative oxidase [Coprinopsis cinerea okayama7|uniref:Alternative oxidase n=1 Tax=Coprinopsis cinerea (strain Okayama-7 / 130 / ATCC MYA-4618 / FGSC 9003) TaxID=240176 RepID=A8NQU0_COPC7|nr:mitochondrial alternative oxidase [Coprinopsis cinerea okayama7\|eukprot:XP_001835681.1 mitochondrial alternative oxidase [Coprinopsis cinerea okayama7\
MLKSTLLRTTAVQLRTPTTLSTARLLARPLVCRGLHSTGYLRSALSASAKTRETHTETRSTKSETKEAPKADPLTTESAVSTVPTMVRGDWVLFHPVYSSEELKAVEVIHREPKTLSDKAARGFVTLARKMFDLVSGYKHKPLPPNYKDLTVQHLRDQGYILDDKGWLRRILFLESIAGVPGMVAATLRHLQSLRLMRRDSGWIHTCLEEAENERMHLMTFMTLRKPSIAFRAMVLGAQGVFYNLFFLSYIFSPKTCHRFVGYLEEEAVVTYTKCIKELEDGLIPEWEGKPAPEIAIDYWRMSPDAKMIDLLYAVRSDESTHRFVNHSLANLNHDTDVNPFALREPDMHTKGKKIEFERHEAEAYIKESHELLGKK